jgi:hypothetical protein
LHSYRAGYYIYRDLRSYSLEDSIHPGSCPTGMGVCILRSHGVPNRLTKSGKCEAPQGDYIWDICDFPSVHRYHPDNRDSAPILTSKGVKHELRCHHRVSRVHFCQGVHIDLASARDKNDLSNEHD